MKRVAGAVVMAALISLSLVAVATAHTVRHDSTITFQVNDNNAQPRGVTPIFIDSFEGRVSSDKTRCVATRQVRIVRVVENSDDVLVTDGFTDANGDYLIPSQGHIPPGTYYAVAVRKVLRDKADHKHVCKRAVSPEQVVQAPPP